MSEPEPGRARESEIGEARSVLADLTRPMQRSLEVASGFRYNVREERRTMTDATEIWQAVRGRTRDLSKTISEDERIRSAAKKTRDASYQGLTKTRRMATQEEAWESALATLEELTEVVISHHQLILSLMERVDELEQAVADGVPQPSTEGAT